jgi:hypothetical protein
MKNNFETNNETLILLAGQILDQIGSMMEGVDFEMETAAEDVEEMKRLFAEFEEMMKGLADSDEKNVLTTRKIKLVSMLEKIEQDFKLKVTESAVLAITGNDLKIEDDQDRIDDILGKQIEDDEADRMQIIDNIGKKIKIPDNVREGVITWFKNIFLDKNSSSNFDPEWINSKSPLHLLWAAGYLLDYFIEIAIAENRQLAENEMSAIRNVFVKAADARLKEAKKSNREFLKNEAEQLKTLAENIEILAQIVMEMKK